jgi:malyl-CoA/(S)-citramalyl-CoA lyase
MTSSPRITRTYLAVPAHRAAYVASAARSTADAVFMDLEDAVPPDAKALALSGACDALQTVDWGRKTVAVRINTFSHPGTRNEVITLSRMTRLDALIIPKAEHVDDIMTLCAWLDEAAKERDGAPLELELLIETALGLVNVEALASLSRPNNGVHGARPHENVTPRISALHFGVGDFAASIGARSAEIGGSPEGYVHTSRSPGGYTETPLDIVAYPMMRILTAARAYGLRAIDGPCGAFTDATLTREWARKAAAMGFDGKQVIHPGQIEATRAAFQPSEAEHDFAARVVAAMQEAEKTGLGAVQIDGKLIDYANVRMAERILRLSAG